jgi:hypothetical protein
MQTSGMEGNWKKILERAIIDIESSGFVQMPFHFTCIEMLPESR